MWNGPRAGMGVVWATGDVNLNQTCPDVMDTRGRVTLIITLMDWEARVTLIITLMDWEARVTLIMKLMDAGGWRTWIRQSGWHWKGHVVIAMGLWVPRSLRLCYRSWALLWPVTSDFGDMERSMALARSGDDGRRTMDDTGYLSKHENSKHIVLLTLNIVVDIYGSNVGQWHWWKLVPQYP